MAVPAKDNYDAVVIGGGFFGCELARFLSGRFRNVILTERAPALMTRASYNNQARVHNGYHYPRSVLTALRSRVNYPHFLREFSGAVDQTFSTYYAVGRRMSNVTANQFRTFCERIEAPIRQAPREIARLFDSGRIEAVFEVEECAFDAIQLRKLVERRLEESKVEVLLDTEVISISSSAFGARLRLRTAEDEREAESSLTFLCTYSGINDVLARSGLPLVPLKHEMTEIALVEAPEEIKNIGITVVCGPFFSTMPFPPAGLHSLSHVRYTPHYSWLEGGREGAFEQRQPSRPASQWKNMVRDAQRYVPALGRVNYVQSLWEVKTVLPRSEVDDSRPVLFRRNERIPSLYSVMGGKIDNIFDIRRELELELEGVRA